MPDHPFAERPRVASEHFRLWFYAAVMRVLDQVLQSYESSEAAFRQFPFLEGYLDQVALPELDAMTLAEASGKWHGWLSAWEAETPVHLPLRELAAAARLGTGALTLLMCVGLMEEDPRFGQVFAALQGDGAGQRRPTAGLLQAWLRAEEGDDGIRADLRRLMELDLIQVVDPSAPRLDWPLQVPGPLWDALRGDVHERPASGLGYRAPEHLRWLDELILPETERTMLARLPALLKASDRPTVLVRGPRRNGRRTVLGAVARALGRGLLEVDGSGYIQEQRRAPIGPLATILHALPVMVFEPGPGETVKLPPLPGYDGPVGVVLGRTGGLEVPGGTGAVSFNLDMPDRTARRRHWMAGAEAGADSFEDLDAVSQRYRMTSGNVRRAAALARAHAALAGRPAISLDDVQRAGRTLNRQALETLAQPVAVAGDWDLLAVGAGTMAELRILESRCCHRENIGVRVGPALDGRIGPGVRALLKGPSGTGKTLAAKLLAARLGQDLYRIDLSSVVNKYIGETEKNLDRLFTLAEELDVILLLDEGDALLTQRTSVQNANDRYANLETNYLLQRIEALESILIVTTNAVDRIDSAFQRRMDVVVDFALPEAVDRWAIWLLHLPSDHQIDGGMLREVAARCALTGGQIRNAVLHTALLALEDGGIVTAEHLELAVRREYRKTGAVCPLRRFQAAAGAG